MKAVFKSNRGSLELVAVSMVALALLLGAAYFYYNKAVTTSQNTSTSQTKSTPKEIKADSDASQIDSTLNTANDANLEGIQPSDSDLGL